MEPTQIRVFIEFYHFNMMLRDLFVFYSSNTLQKKFIEEVGDYYQNSIKEDALFSILYNALLDEKKEEVKNNLERFAKDMFKDYHYFNIHDDKIEINPEKRVEFFQNIILLRNIISSFLINFIAYHKKENNAQDVITELEKAFLEEDKFFRSNAGYITFFDIVRMASSFNQSINAKQNKLSLEDRYTLNLLRELTPIYHAIRNDLLSEDEVFKQNFEDGYKFLQMMDGSLKVEKEEFEALLDKIKQNFTLLLKNCNESWAKEHTNIVQKYVPVINNNQTNEQSESK